MATIRYKFFAEWTNPIINNSNTELYPYSGFFKNLKSADKWFNRYGKKLEKQFNRKLILCMYELGKNHNKYDFYKRN